MCCWTADRQANDNNGNCATPYDTNCVNADPGDNTDLCAVDMERAGHSRSLDVFTIVCGLSDRVTLGTIFEFRHKS